MLTNDEPLAEMMMLTGVRLNPLSSAYDDITSSDVMMKIDIFIAFFGIVSLQNSNVLTLQQFVIKC